MKFNKKMSKSGSITLPAALRRDLGINEGEKFSIMPSNNGDITLTRIQGECIFCQSHKELLVYKGRFVCNQCASSMITEGRAV